MATRAILTPYAAEFPGSNFPELGIDGQRRPYLAFDASTNETAYWTVVIPQGWTGTISLIVSYYMATATTGDVDLDGAIEAVTDGDALDLDSASSFDTVNSTDNTTVPGTQGYIDQITITLTNNDSSAAADYARVSLARDAANDTAAGDMRVISVELRDGA